MMIFLLLFMVNASDLAQARTEITRQSPTGLTAEINFSETGEENYYTRFILSSTEPACLFDLLDGDTLRDPAIRDDGSEIITVGRPVSLSRYNLYPVMVKPVVKRQGYQARIKRIRLRLSYTPCGGINFAPALASVYRNLIWNYQYDPTAKPQGLLIITPNSFSTAVRPLAEWKEKKGWKVTTATLSQTGYTNSSIKNYITNAYQTWTPAPEYVLLIGDKDSLPTFTINSNPTDHPYTTLEGSDFFSELLVGRISVANVNELNTVVAKIVGYETTPYVTDTAWFGRGLMVGANYPSGMTTPVPMKRWVREKMLAEGFRQVDTVYYPPISNGVTAITNAVNQGVTVINYRGGIATWGGWDYPSFYNTDVQGLSNGWKLPVITSIVCLTGNYNAEPCFGESWLRAGNPVTPKGGIGFFGASPPTTHSRWNNCLDAGIYWGLLEEDIHFFGPMTYRGKMEVYANFPLETSPTSGSEFYFNAYNLLGDPSLEIWTGVPQSLNVSHLSAISTGTNSFAVQVLDAASQPLSGALVSLYKRSEVKALDYTDAAGQVALQINTSTPDTLFVTVTRHNYRPYCGFALVSNAAVYVGYLSHTISDPSGNNNGEINPGEEILAAVTLKNYGTTTTADNVWAKLTCADPLVTVTDSLKSYGSIAPGGTASAAPFVFSVSPGAKHNHALRFSLVVTSNQGNWNSTLGLSVKAPDFEYGWHQVADGGNLVLEPGETSDLIVSIGNTGGLAGTGLYGILRSLNPAVTIGDSTGFYGTVNPGDSAANSSDRYRVSAAAAVAPGHEIDFLLLISGDAGFQDEVYFSLTIGPVTSSSPLGPDPYGYYAYDNTDAGYPETPVYSWIEIDPGFGGPGTALTIDNDETKTFSLPFSFKYYGTNYNRISICSNGYLALDSTWIADMYNWHIPSAGGPPLLVAPFWDDLDPNASDSSRDIYYYSDAASHRLIIEYSRIQHLHDPTNPQPAELQTFEVILLDPAYYPTQTGDGEIIYQYLKILNDDAWHDYATCGIENFGHTSGLEYTFANSYPAAAAPLADGRAIKFTTDQPDPFPGVGEDENITGGGILLCAYPNPVRKSVSFKFETNNNLQIPNVGRGSSASLTIFDVTGRCIKTFSSLSPKSSALTWRCLDNAGRQVPPGVYFASLTANREKQVIKFIVIE
jgi:hypothetical protein